MEPHQVLHILDLPDEVLIKIFSYLSNHDRIVNVRQTCWRFRQLSLAPSLWKSLTVEAERGEAHLSKLLSQQCVIRGQGSESDSVEDNQGTSSTLEVKSIVTSVREHGKVAPSCSVTGQMVYPKLKALKLESPDLPQMSSLARYSALQSLVVNVEACDYKSDENLAEILNFLKDLKDLRTLSFNVERVVYSPNAVVKLKASFRDYFLSGPKLKAICLDVDVNEDIVSAILDNCTGLQELILPLCQSDLSGAFRTASKKPSLLLSGLLIGVCPGLDDNCLKSIGEAFPNLRKLSLKLTAKTSDKGLACLFRACSGLRVLALASPSAEDGGNDGGHALLGNTASGLCLQDIARKEARGNLRGLFLYNFRSLDEHVFTAVCKNQPNLTSVGLKNCRVSDDELVFMANNCRRLKSVKISECGLSPNALTVLDNLLERERERVVEK